MRATVRAIVREFVREFVRTFVRAFVRAFAGGSHCFVGACRSIRLVGQELGFPKLRTIYSEHGEERHRGTGNAGKEEVRHNRSQMGLWCVPTSTG